MDLDRLRRLIREIGVEHTWYRNSMAEHLKDAVTDTSCPQDIKEEILEYIAKIERETTKIEWVRRRDFLGMFYQGFVRRRLNKDYIQIIGEIIYEKEPNWNELRMKLQRIYQEYAPELPKWEEIFMELQRIYQEDVPERYWSDIYIDKLDGTQHAIENVDKKDGVNVLIDKVSRCTGIPKGEFVLVHDEKILKPGDELTSFNLQEGSHIKLFPIEKDQGIPANVRQLVLGLFNGLFGKIEKLFHWCPQVFQDCTRSLSEKDFVKVSQLICDGWQLLGTHLGLDKVAMEHITQDNQTVRVRIFEMLRQWQRKNPLEATAGKLVSAIKDCNLECDFDRLKNAILIGI